MCEYFHLLQNQNLKEMWRDCKKWKIVWKIYILSLISSAGNSFIFGLESHLFKTQGKLDF